MSNFIEILNILCSLAQNIFPLFKLFFTMPILPFTIIVILTNIMKRKSF